MSNFGVSIKKLREGQSLPLRIVAAALDIDQAILSKIERGHRKPSRELVIRIAAYFKVPENELLVDWLSDKVLYELGNDELGLQALQVAEEQMAYQVFKKTDRKTLIEQLSVIIKGFDQIEKAWIYGSFARGDDGPKSDIDIAIQTAETFTYFDLAEVKHDLEKSMKRKCDIGFIDSFKPYIYEHLKPDLTLIYEKRSHGKSAKA